MKRLLLPSILICVFFAAPWPVRAQDVPGRAEDVSAEKVFAAVPFEQWVKQGPQTHVPWKVQIQQYGLSLHQRLYARVTVELKRRELARIPPEDRILVLIEVTDSAGQRFRDYVLFRTKEMAAEIQKGEVNVFWAMFVAPGEYGVTLVLVKGDSGEHNLMRGHLHVNPVKNDPMPQVSAGLPVVEFLDTRMKGPDAMFRPEISSRLHLPLQTERPVRLELLVDVTASDLFHGSTSFYNRYLSVALPLLKALTQISLQHGSIDVAMLDLRKHAVTFEQDEVKELDWKRAKAVLAPENGPATIDIKALEQRRESPAFLQDELLCRLNTVQESPESPQSREIAVIGKTSRQQSTGEPGPTSQDDPQQNTPKQNAPRDETASSSQTAPDQRGPLHVFVIIGSPMDFYSFRDLPRLPAGSEEKCVVYYLQFELLNTTYADGAIGNVRKMLKPLPLRVFKVRTPESLRHALARIVEEVSSM